jgi:hypothetical protein
MRLVSADLDRALNQTMIAEPRRGTQRRSGPSRWSQKESGLQEEGPAETRRCKRSRNRPRDNPRSQSTPGPLQSLAIARGEMTLLGTGFWDKFKVFPGGSIRFEEWCGGQKN